MEVSIEELLEQEERKAAAKDAAKKAGNDTPESSSRDPRRNGRGRQDDEYRPNSNRYSAEREENDQRRSRKSRELAEDEDMKDASDKGSANGSIRSRRRSRSPDSERRRRSSHDRDAYRDRDRLDRGGDFYSGGGRSSLGDDRYRPCRDDGERPRTRDRERDRTPRRGDRDRDHRDPRARRRSPDPPKKAKTPEPTDDERDRRTVFVQQLAARLRTKELKAFFEQVGAVVDAQIVKDRVSGRSKGSVKPITIFHELANVSQRRLRRIQGGRVSAEGHSAHGTEIGRHSYHCAAH